MTNPRSENDELLLRFNVARIVLAEEEEEEEEAHTVVSLLDVTEQKQAEQEIASLAKFPSENPNPVLRLSRDGIVLYANAPSGALLGMWGCAVGGSAPQFWRDLAVQVLASRENKIVDIECDGKVYSMFVTPVDEPGYVNLYARDITARKRAEAQLVEHHATLNALMESAATPVFSLDRDYRYTSFNSAHAAVMKALYGAEIEIGQSMLEYMTVLEDREESRKNLDRALLGEKVVESSYSGEPGRLRRYFEVAHNPIFATAGEVIGVSVFVSDITEHKQAEEALRESEQRLATLITNLPGFVYRCVNDRNWTMKFISEGCRTITGYAPEDFLQNKKLAYNDIIRLDCREQLWLKWALVHKSKRVDEQAQYGQ